MQLSSRLSRARAARPERRGAALMLALLVLFVLVAIVFQINIATSTDARVARNEITLASMDLAIESTLLEVFETLKMDAEADASEGAAGPWSRRAGCRDYEPTWPSGPPSIG